MRRSILRTTALLACAVVAAAFLAIPSASAQTESTFSVEQPIACGTSLFGRISTGVAPYTVSYRLQGLVDVTLPPFTVGAEGAFQSPANYMNRVPYGSYMIAAIAADSSGQQSTTLFAGIVSDTCGATAGNGSSAPSGSAAGVSAPAGAASLFVVPAPIAGPGADTGPPTPQQPLLAQAAPIPAAAAVAQAAPATEAAPPQAAATATAPTATLAATGAKADLPMMVGSLLVAAGAAVLAGQQRRRRW